MAQKIQNVNLQLKWKHQFQFAGYYAAIEKGYYNEVGIQAHLIEAVAGKNPIDAVLDGSAEFGIATPDILLFQSENKKPVVLATIFQHSPLILLASKKSGIEHVHDLVGKKISLEANAANIVAYMNDEGVTLDKCIISNHLFDGSMLINGGVDAISAYSTDETFVLREAQFDYTIISPSTGGIDFYGDLLFTTQSLIEKNPTLVNNFRNASLKGWKYAMENPQEIIDLIYTKYSKRHSLKHLQYEAEHMKSLIMHDVLEIGYTNPGRWKSIIEIYKKQNLLDDSFNQEGILYSDYIKPKIVIPWKLLVILVLIIFVIGSVAFFFYRTSQKLKSEIKKRQITEESLVQSEARYRTIIQASPDSIAITDLDSRIIMVSPAALKMFGFENEEEILGRLVSDFVAPEDKNRAEDNIASLFQGTFSGLGDYIGVRSDGSFFDQESNAEFIRDAEGRPIQMIFVVRDITQRKLADKEIRKLSVAVDQNPATIVITDINGYIEYANPKFTELTGYTVQEARGLSPNILKSGKTDPQVFMELWKTISSGKVWKGEFFNKKKNGEEFIEKATIAPIFNEKGAIINYISIKEDITEKKNQEEIIGQKNNQLKDLIDTKNKFFGIIAHDLRSPFVGILGYSDLLVSSLHLFSKEETLQYVLFINESAHSAFNLLENLLEWAMSQTGIIEFNPETLDLGNLIDEIIQITKSLSSNKNIEVTYEKNGNIQIFADKNMLNTVLRNLVTNAIKYTNRSGLIKIKVEANTNFYQISVIDNGVGISDEMAGKLFKTNEKTSTLGTEGEKGTSLGLLLCKEFIEKHGGQIWVESQIGKGSEFKFTIPI